jgi:prophage antirepressor-like protein
MDIVTVGSANVAHKFQCFYFDSASVRADVIDGNLWFIASDVLQAIKSSTTVTAATEIINDYLGGEFVINQVTEDSSGRMQSMTVFHEAAATLLISRSRTAKGKAFNRHLHSVILPTLRKTGKFIAHPEFETDAFDIPKNYPDALRLAADLFDELHGLKQLASSNEGFTLKQQELKRIEDELLDFEIAEKRSKLDFAKAKSTVVFNKGVAAWADEYLAYKIGNFEYVGMNAAFTDTLRYSYLSYCDRADFKPLGFQRFTPELIKYLQKGKKWKNLIRNRDSRGSRIFNIALI